MDDPLDDPLGDVALPGPLGHPVLRREDERHLRGAGRFTDDLAPRDAVHLVVVRSPHGHARIRRIDTAAAAGMPGVVSVWTGAELAGAPAMTGDATAGPLRPLPVQWRLPGMAITEHHALAPEVARFHGEGVAVVVAETAEAAVDAAEMVDVDWEVLPAVTDPRAAADPDAPVLHPDLDGAEGNVLVSLPAGGGNFARARRRADVVIQRTLRNQRVQPTPLEPRAVVAEPGADGRLTVTTATQAPHRIRRFLAESLGIGEHLLRVVAPDVGGGFGAKLHLHPEEVLVAFAARELGRPVRWVATRTEDLLASNHGRDQVQEAELVATSDGRILGLRVRIWAGVGGYLSGMGAGVPAINTGLMVTGVYDISDVDVVTHVVATNTPRVDTYRGAGRPEATYLIERLVDDLAIEVGLDPVEVRRRNLVRRFPHRLPSKAFRLDSGDYEAALDLAVDLADLTHARRRQQAAREEGRLVGLGVALYTEFTGLGPHRALNLVGYDNGGWEHARVSVHPTGDVTVRVGTADHGQGHATTYAQIAGAALGLPTDRITVLEGDTDWVDHGNGTYNSRSMATGGMAVHQAATAVRQKARRVAANALGLPADDVDLVDGHFVVLEPSTLARGLRTVRHGARGLAGAAVGRVTRFQLPDDGMGRHSLAWDEVAQLATSLATYPRGEQPGLETSAFYTPKDMVFPFGAYIAEVEVDPGTGEVTIAQLVAVDDCGPVLNPLLARGQIHGGAAQGLGQALLEGARANPDGTSATGTLQTYAIPRAGDVPRIVAEHTVTPTPHNELGVKGVGEAATIATPAVLVSAVHDALRPLGVPRLDMPLTPARVLAAIHAAQDRS